jgi:hypothetical protein
MIRIVILFPNYAFGCRRFDKDMKLEQCKDKPRRETKVAFGGGRHRSLREDVGKFVDSIYNTKIAVCWLQTE